MIALGVRGMLIHNTAKSSLLNMRTQVKNIIINGAEEGLK